MRNAVGVTIELEQRVRGFHNANSTRRVSGGLGAWVLEPMLTANVW